MHRRVHFVLLFFGFLAACGSGPAEADSPGAASNCDPNYTGACVPRYPPDVDCADIGQPVRVVGSDPHRLDADGDGIGCESS